MISENPKNRDAVVAKRGKKDVLLELVMINGVEYWRPLVSGVDIKPLYEKACRILKELGVDPQEYPPRMEYEVNLNTGIIRFWPSYNVNLFDLDDNKGGKGA